MARRIFITGVGRGLGHELAGQLCDRGDTVFGSTRDGTCDLPLAGTVSMDMSSPRSIKQGATALAAMTPSLDTLINCAGTDSRAFGADPGARGPFDVSASAFNDVMAVNVTGPMVLTTATVDLLRSGNDPMILNISSQLGSMDLARTMGADTPYCVSKAALNMLSVKTAAELRSDGIGVIMLHPGWVQTDMGGPSASLTVPESASSIITTLHNLSIADTGRFIRWDGTDHPW